MEYTHIPVAFEAPTDADYAAFCAAMERIGDAPVHVHCIVNMRASAFLYRWQVDHGVDVTAARARMEEIRRPGGVWAAFVGNAAVVPPPHRGPGDQS